MPKEKFIITFAGPRSCSKTPIAYYLSWKLELPIFNNDAVRTEVIADLGYLDKEEYLKRRDERIDEILGKNRSFICDASMDRVWKDWKSELVRDYKVFIISFDLSKSFLSKLYSYKNSEELMGAIDESMSDHDSFLKEYAGDVSFRITDENFKDRLKLSYEAVERWMRNN